MGAPPPRPPKPPPGPPGPPAGGGAAVLAPVELGAHASGPPAPRPPPTPPPPPPPACAGCVTRRFQVTRCTPGVSELSGRSIRHKSLPPSSAIVSTRLPE